jgi:hypothetical protein
VEDAAAEVLATERTREVDQRFPTQPELPAVGVAAERGGEAPVADRAQAVGGVHEQEANAVRAGERRRRVGRTFLRVVEAADPDVVLRGRQSDALVHERADAGVGEPAHDVPVVR